MRNWNVPTLPSKTATATCFYSTYEELKLNNLFFCWSITIRFYSTYEELKPLLGGVYDFVQTRFYSTYEELKPTVAESV